MKKLMFAAALVSTSMLVAQEMVEPDAVADAAYEEEVAEQVEDSEVVSVDTDQGAEIAEQFVGTTVEAPADGEFIDAETRVRGKLASSGLAEGYDEKRNAIIVIGTSFVKITDPANDSSFMRVRAAKATEAYLNAKRGVIEAINTNFEGMDRLLINSIDGTDDVQAALAEKHMQLEEKKAELVKKMAQLDGAEAAALDGVTLSDRFGAILDGIAKKLDTEYDPEKIAEGKKAVRDQLAQEVASLKEEFVALQEQAEAIPPFPTNELASTAQALSKMTLLGSTVLAQAESWDATEKLYSVSMAVVWSPKLQQMAEDLMVNPAAVVAKPNPDAPNRQEWLQEQDLSVMVGPRSFTDKNGNKIFVGIAAVDLTGPVSKIGAKRRDAALDAQKAVALSLLADINSQTASEKILREYTDDLRASMTKLTDALTQSCDVNLQGCMPMTSATLKHPISGRKIFVSVYYIEPALAKNAQEILEKAYASATKQTKAMNYRRGRHAGAEAVLDSARKSKADFNRGVADGKKSVEEKAKPRAKKAVSRGPTGSKRTAPAGKSQGGSFSSDSGTIDADF